MKKGKYGGDESAAVKATVRSMIEGLHVRAQKFGLKFLVLPVAPPTRRSNAKESAARKAGGCFQLGACQVTWQWG